MGRLKVGQRWQSRRMPYHEVMIVELRSWGRELVYRSVQTGVRRFQWADTFRKLFRRLS